MKKVFTRKDSREYRFRNHDEQKSDLRNLRREDWDCYGIPYYGEHIKKVGDDIIEILLREHDAIRITEAAWMFAGLPHDYRAFRGLFAYIARKVVKNGAVFVAAPIIKPTLETYHQIICDYEFAIIEPYVRNGAEEWMKR